VTHFEAQDVMTLLATCVPYMQKDLWSQAFIICLLGNGHIAHSGTAAFLINVLK